MSKPKPWATVFSFKLLNQSGMKKKGKKTQTKRIPSRIAKIPNNRHEFGIFLLVVLS